MVTCPDHVSSLGLALKPLLPVHVVLWSAGVPRNLLIRFKDDSIDDSNGLASLLQVGWLGGRASAGM